MISSMNSKWPSKLILIRKTDIDAADHRIHTNTRIAATCIYIVDKLTLLCIPLTYSTTPAPSEYTTIIEAAIDLRNDLLREKSWGATEIK